MAVYPPPPPDVPGDEPAREPEKVGLSLPLGLFVAGCVGILIWLGFG